MSVITPKFRPAKRPIWMVVAALAVAAALAIQGPTPALAYADDLEIKCNQNPVSEGDSYRLHIEKPGNMSGQPLSIRNETMKVYWTTESDTADASDYSALYHEGQASNHFQSWNGRMGRTFYTTEDDLSELTEQFTVRAENAGKRRDGWGMWHRDRRRRRAGFVRHPDHRGAHQRDLPTRRCHLFQSAIHPRRARYGRNAHPGLARGRRERGRTEPPRYLC